ncbi:MAG: tetratricopeptide repeat protein [Bacteriovoracia bacterium]
MDQQKFYKVRLQSGRVIGPIDLDRVRLFIVKNQISGLEQARVYPDGDWQDINRFPEIAKLLLAKLEGSLTDTQDQTGSTQSQTATKPKEPTEGFSDQSLQSLAKKILDANTGSKIKTDQVALDLSKVEEQKPVEQPQEVLPKTQPEEDSEKTIIVTPASEATMIVPAEQLKVQVTPAGDEKVQLVSDEVSSQVSLQTEHDDPIDSQVSQEKTQVLQLDRPKPGLTKQRKIFIAIGLVCMIALALLPDEEQKILEPAFNVQLPSQLDPDPQYSEKYFNSGLSHYVKDSPDQYKKAAKFFLRAASTDSNNAKALALLASSYMNLFDFVDRNENYFSVITKLIELARAKTVDIAEAVVADVELYLMLGNPDAAENRIIEFTKVHQFGVEMFYYMALSQYYKGNYEEAFKYIRNIDPSNFFSPKIPYLWGQLFERSNQPDEAIKAYERAISMNPRHVKSRLRLAALSFSKDKLPMVVENLDYILANESLASKPDLARAYYLRARTLEVSGNDIEALAKLQMALKYQPNEPDFLMEYYTLRGRAGQKTNDGPQRAKYFLHMTEGEKAIKARDLNKALAEFLSARELAYDDPAPLVKLAEVFRAKGDLQAAKTNYEKAVTLRANDREISRKYTKTLIDAYEFVEAEQALKRYIGLNPPEHEVDILNGDLSYLQGRYRQAFAYYKRAISKSNIDSSAYISFANVMFKVGNFQDAAFYYGLALRFDPLNVEATNGAGKALAEIQGLEKGIEYIQNVMNRSPYKAPLLNGIAETYARKGDYNSAIKYADLALEKDPTLAVAYKTRGEAYVGLEKTKEALDSYRTYVTLSPLDPSARIEKYKIYLKKMDLKSARQEIEEVIKAYPHYPGAYYMLGELFNLAQNHDSALKAAQAEIQNNAGYVPAYVLAGTIYNIKKEYRKSIETLTKALNLDQNYVPALIQAGFANHMLKTYAAAQSMLERALAQDQGNPQIHKRLGYLYNDMGDKAKAKEHIRKYLDLMPDAPDRNDLERFAR